LPEISIKPLSKDGSNFPPQKEVVSASSLRL
jgi:hypothetical protein